MLEEIKVQAQQTRDRLKTKVGNTQRERHIMTEACLAAEVLLKENLTIDFDACSKEAKEIGLRSIWDHIAYRHVWDGDSQRMNVDPTLRERAASVEDNAGSYQAGFRQLERLFRLHHHRQLFIVPRRAAAGRVEVITLDSDYQVNADQTALEVAERRTVKHVGGQIRSCMEKAE